MNGFYAIHTIAVRVCAPLLRREITRVELRTPGRRRKSSGIEYADRDGISTVVLIENGERGQRVDKGNSSRVRVRAG